jgi:uncharacterized membrane protein YfcA
MIVLALAFCATALIYAIAGFGGGSTYTALLVLARTDYHAVPILSLACNILVVTAGTWRFARAGHFGWKRSWPLLVTSVPAAWLGGRLDIPKEIFLGALAVSLLVAGLVMLWQPYWKRDIEPAPSPRSIEPVAGGTLGFLAGVVGIGGGIFLAPLLYMLRWDSPRRIAATCAAFILVNSIAGLGGQASKGVAAARSVIADHALLFPAVLAGGLVGAGLGARKIEPQWVRIVTALLILYVAVRLGLEAFT